MVRQPRFHLLKRGASLREKGLGVFPRPESPSASEKNRNIVWVRVITGNNKKAIISITRLFPP
ncbi:MAG: hypothetical protein ACI8V2_000677 [Candidatus Latescibacterota bacterium]|jgi:hypothetical protein